MKIMLGVAAVFIIAGCAAFASTDVAGKFML
jgi:hypothetical protein